MLSLQKHGIYQSPSFINCVTKKNLLLIENEQVEDVRTTCVPPIYSILVTRGPR